METGAEEKFDNETCEDSDSGQNQDELMPSTSSRNQVGRKSLSGQVCSLKTLIDDQVMEPGQSILTMDYNGTKFSADLLSNGNIRDSKQIFTNPSAWFNHCKRQISSSDSMPNKAGSAWSIIRYKGKRLDSYKLRWYRKQKKIVSSATMYETAMALSKAASEKINSSSSGPSFSQLHKEITSPTNFFPEEYPVKEKNVVDHQSLGSRLQDRSSNIMVKCTPFSALERIQPFTISISTNTLLIIDFHCHLTTGEVIGYLGGTWDESSHNVSILHAFPCKSRLGDKERSTIIEEEIRQNLEQHNLTVVGWYHSHPFAAPQPTLRDIDSQLDYQMVLRGDSDVNYIPCIGLICSSYEPENPRPTSRYQAFWVMPPSEYKPNEFGRPMQMIYSIARDSFLTQDLLLDMRLLAHYYTDGPDSVKFTEIFRDGLTNWEKLQYSLQPNLPRDLTHTSSHQNPTQIQVQQQALSHFWAFLKGLILT
ncbi:MPN domain-containing protein [Brevipalpus obovatus]|uniref:MPN domain-containing protein n=1 Tax=Brevipalpus obovatus TaxID=246614 RepID=UPI003D9DFABC